MGKSKHGFDARREIDNLISNPDISLVKDELVKDYFIQKDEYKNEKIIFSKSNDNIRKYAKKVESAYDKVCSWYEKEEWIDKENFEEVYAEKITRTWNLLRDEIDAHPNKEYCVHFRNVAKDFREKGYDKPVYKGPHMD